MKTGSEINLSAGQEITLDFPVFYSFPAGLDGELFFRWKNEKIFRNYFISDLESLRSVTGFPSDSPLQLVIRLRKESTLTSTNIADIRKEEIFHLHIEHFLKLIWGFIIRLEDPVMIHSAETDMLFPVRQISWVVCSHNCSIGPVMIPEGLRIPVFPGQKLYGDEMIPVISSASFFRENEPKDVLVPLYQFIFNHAGSIIASLNAEKATSLNIKLYNENLNAVSGLMELASSLGNTGIPPHTEPEKRNNWIESLNVMADLLGFRKIKAGEKFENIKDLLDQYSNSHHFKYRRINLSGEWWKMDHGPLLLISDEGISQIAEYSKSGYRIRKNTGKYAAINKKFDGEAFMLYCTLGDEKITLIQLLKFAIKGKGHCLFLLLLSALGATVFAALIPILTATLFNTILPAAEIGLLYATLSGFVLLVFSFFIFQLVRNFLLNKLEGMIDMRIQSAVLARLLELPLSFFNQFSSTELSNRVMGVNTIRTLFTRSLSSTLAAILTLIINLGVMFYLIPRLAIVFTILVLVYYALMSVLTVKEINILRSNENKKDELSGTLQQMLNGILRIKLSGAESRAFTNWAGRFGIMEKQRTTLIRLATINRQINKHAPIVFSIFILFFGVQFARYSGVGTFIAFQSAFGSFFAAALAISSSMSDFSELINLSKRLLPILQEPQEVTLKSSDPGVIGGDIELTNVKFKYREDGPYVLDGLSLKIKPGEFLAIVGSSGCGKSTLMRILLGFEKPGSGSIFFDEKELIQLDIRKVRKQFGVVMQATQIFSGSIMENIIGNGNLTIKDAWHTAKKAGIAEEIEALPMGMNTFLSESGETLSGGQKQKILIARALAHDPAILIFDEATSALDNLSQKTVMESIEKMEMTRIVIAHRFSTIRNADRIVVLHSGKIVQEGNYEQLLAKPGLFRELAERQVVSTIV